MHSQKNDIFSPIVAYTFEYESNIQFFMINQNALLASALWALRNFELNYKTIKSKTKLVGQTYRLELS